MKNIYPTRLILIVCLILSLVMRVNGQQAEGQTPYNVLFIAIDDLNDYVGAFGGNPQSMTPNIDRLAAEGMRFYNAHCAASLCKPSRTALLSGFRPSTTGVYGNGEVIRDMPVLTHCYMLPEWLSMHGYFTTSRGKIFHRPGDEKESWDEWVATSGKWGKPAPVPEGYNYNMLPADKAGNFDWGPTSVSREETPAYQTAKWVESLLNRSYDTPFFIAAGIFRPHLPWFVPKEYFDKFPLEEIRLPEIREDDMEDIPGQDPMPLYELTRQYGKRKEAMQAYLASANAADDAVGVMLDALAASPYRENTIVILWGDHGWHLGEKLRYKKFTLWEEATRMPLIIKVPGLTIPGSYTKVPVNLIDLYPTITALCGVPPNTNNEGESLCPLLQDPTLQQEDISLCTMGEENHTIRSNRWRFIQRKGQPQELYDHRVDSMEFYNLYDVASYEKIRSELKFLLDSLLFRANESMKPVRKNTIPGVIQAEKFDRGGEGISYHDTDGENDGFSGQLIYYREAEGVDIWPCDDMGGGFYVGGIERNEWLKFTVEDVEPGTYSVDLRIRSGQTGSLVSAYLDGQSLFTGISKEAVPGSWVDLKIEPVRILHQGPAVLMLKFNGTPFQLNQVTFNRTGPLASARPCRKGNGIEVFSAPDQSLLYIKGVPCEKPCQVELYDLNGSLCFRSDEVAPGEYLTIPVNGKKGLFMVRILDEGAAYSGKVVLL